MKQISTDSKVVHIKTGAEGEVVQGGFRPRVRWPTGYINRCDHTELRVIAEGIPGGFDRMIDYALANVRH